ncbi:MAG: NUDIX hydrolase [Gallionellaceae bacterium]|nr:NUDIX hydrolase [Gallionellaceae bacterium]
MNLQETQIETELVYEGNFIQVHIDKVSLPDGSISSREYLKHPGAVAVIALLDNGNLIMERQFRYAPQQEFIELPAGKIDHGEDTLITAKRELLEETGYVASEWTHLSSAWPCIGYADERMEYYLARGLTHKGRQLDEGEFLEVFELSPAEAIEWIRLGKITDSKTIVGLFWMEKTLKGWA